jgi:hypothetical protein
MAQKRIRVVDEEVPEETVSEEAIETPAVDDVDADEDAGQRMLRTRGRVKFSNDEEEEAWFEDEYEPKKKPPTTPQIITQLAQIELDIRCVFYAGNPHGNERHKFYKKYGSEKRRRRRVRVLKALNVVIEELELDNALMVQEGSY